MFAAVGFVVLVVAACVVNFQKAVPLLVLSCVLALCFLWDRLLKPCYSNLCHKLRPCTQTGTNRELWIQRYFTEYQCEDMSTTAYNRLTYFCFKI